MKVFISSTVYDLIDMRAEVEELLRDIGAIPILSESLEGGFEVHKGINSIDNCIVNVVNSDHVIVILDKRYGPALKAYNHKLSATHLEYQAAIGHNKHIIFLVRDRLVADINICKKNRGAAHSYSWVDDNQINNLLQFFNEAKSRTDRDNWIHIYRNSIEAKSIIRKRLKVAAAQHQIIQALKRNEFPLLSVKHKASPFSDVTGDTNVKCVFEIRNISSAAAFDLIISLTDEQAEENVRSDPDHSIFPPLETTTSLYYYDCVKLPGRQQQRLLLRYKSAEGIEVREIYLAWSQVKLVSSGAPALLISGCKLEQRTMKLTGPPIINIEMSDG